ncbi:MAG: Clp protease ClpP [Ramlibacter sp.]|jgi:ClpP class serine protease|nr:Clp protease ClpP [Ramlibacter sp.]
MKLIELLNKPWAILPESLREIHAIYESHLKGEKTDVAAVEARLGRPLNNEQQTYTVREGGVAVLNIEGVIAPKANLFTQISGGVSAALLVQQLQSIAADSRVKSAIQVIDSPGGSVFGIPEWAAAVRAVAAVKPVITISDAQIASAAMWGGSAANGVYLTGVTAQAGSIGVYARMGLSQAEPGVIEFTRGKYKRSGINGQAPSPEYMAYFEGYLDHMYSVFVDAIAEFRGTTSEIVLEHMADGRMFTGQQAIDVGLVDGFSTVDAMVEKLATKPEAFAQRRKAVVAMASAPPPPAVAPQKQPPSQLHQGTQTMNRAELAAQHPELLQAILAEGEALGVTRGAAQERARIQGVEAALIPGHETLIASLKFDGKTTGGDAALAVNAAEREIREKQGAAARGDAPPPVRQAAAPAVQPSAEAAAAAEKERLAKLPVDERCKAEWAANADLQAEFGALDAYVAFVKADASGQARIKKAG